MKESGSASTAILLSPARCPPLPPPARGPPSFQTDTCIYFFTPLHFSFSSPRPPPSPSLLSGPCNAPLFVGYSSMPTTSELPEERAQALPCVDNDHGLPTQGQGHSPGYRGGNNDFLLSTYCIPGVTSLLYHLSPFGISEMHGGPPMLQVRKWARQERFV